MAKGSPSLIALLGLLAVAGYQNRDKLGELLNSRGLGDPERQPQGGLAQGGLVDGVRDLVGGAGAGSLMGGLSEVFERFANPVQKAKVDTWVQRGPNAPLAADELAEVLDEETVAELVAKTGLSRDELLSRLSTALPEAVDQVTPDGHFPPISMAEPRSI
jgi:uncharacterized protein YidB (DUF937 family)